MAKPSKMRWVFLINGAAILAVAAYAGWAFSQGRVPGWAIGGAGLSLLILILPFFLEYSAMGRDFGKVGGEFLSDARRPYFPEDDGVEVFSGEGRSHMARRREPVGLYIILTVVALSLSAYDMVQTARHQAAKPSEDRIITNF